MNPIRIWYQSYVDYENGKTYWDRLREHLANIVDPGISVDVHGITPHDNYAHAIVEMRCAREVICNAVRAERAGYDAFIIGHFQDAGLYEARSVVDIPVLALGEASMLYACQLGQHSGNRHDQYPLYPLVPPSNFQVWTPAESDRRPCPQLRARPNPESV